MNWQQHERVTTTTQSNIHKLVSVLEVLFWGDAMQMYPSARDTWWPWGVLHQAIMIFWSMQLRMQIYPVQMCPPLIKPSGTEPYYTRSVWHVEECNWEGRLQSNIPMSDVPPLSEPSGTEPYYTRSVWQVEECNWEGRLQSDVPPGRGIWWPRAVLHNVILTLHRQMYPLLQAVHGQDQ